MRSNLKKTITTTQSKDLSSGFTLVEMLIVISIFVLMTLGAVVNYRTFYQRQQVLQSAKNLQEAMRFAQKKARVGEKPTGCSTLNGYIVSATTSSTTITLTADCTNQDYQVTTMRMSGSARLDEDLSITFTTIPAGVTGAKTVRIVYGDYVYAFDVNSGGDINEGGYEE